MDNGLGSVVSVALTCTGRPASWVPGRVWGAEPRTLATLQVRGVMSAAQVTGRQRQEAQATYPGGLASGGHRGNGQLAGLTHQAVPERPRQDSYLRTRLRRPYPSAQG